MANPYYTPSGVPATNADVASATMRAEFALLQAAFDKFPALSGNALKMLRVNAGATLVEAVTPTVAAVDITSEGGSWSPTLVASSNCSGLSLVNGIYARVGKVFVCMIEFNITRTAAGFMGILCPPPTGTIQGAISLMAPYHTRTDAEYGVGGISSGMNGNNAAISFGGSGTLTATSMAWGGVILMRIA